MPALSSRPAPWQPRDMDTATRATTLLELHHTGSTLVLPNVWDAWSARVVADAGFAALSIGSHPLADSRGQSDNEDMTLDDALDGVRRICSAVPDVPVTADMEAGYGVSPAELVERLLEAGAVGLNVEDTVHSEGGRLRSVVEHADYIGGLRRAADAAGSTSWSTPAPTPSSRPTVSRTPSPRRSPGSGPARRRVPAASTP